MSSVISFILTFCLSFQTFAQGKPIRPLLNKAETQKFVQNNFNKSFSKAEVIKLIKDKYGKNKEDQALIKQLEAKTFERLKMNLGFENGKVVMNITEPEKVTLTITDMDRLGLGAVVNGKTINLKGSLSRLTNDLETLVSKPKSVFHLIFINEADALFWFGILFAAAALGAVVGVGVTAMAGDLAKIESAFDLVKSSCENDKSKGATSQSAETKSAIEALGEFGYKGDNLDWYESADECMRINNEQTSKKFCETNASINSCLKDLAPVSKPTGPLPTQVGE